MDERQNNTSERLKNPQPYTTPEYNVLLFGLNLSVVVMRMFDRFTLVFRYLCWFSL